jgi:hypothetical protein
VHRPHADQRCFPVCDQGYVCKRRRRVVTAWCALFGSRRDAVPGFRLHTLRRTMQVCESKLETAVRRKRTTHNAQRTTHTQRNKNKNKNENTNKRTLNEHYPR